MSVPDPILGLTDKFKADSSPNKINLGVGAYRDNDGKPYILNCVRAAEEQLLKENSDHEYAPIIGIPEFTSATLRLAYGPNCKALQEGRIAVAQSISGTGALRLGGEFIRKFYKQQSEELKIYLPKPTWTNHSSVFTQANMAIASYRYYDTNSKGLDFAGLQEDLKNAPNGSIFLFHSCAHNPTGVDPTEAQWQQICEICQERAHLCFFDMAYQGFASGSPDKDAMAVRMFAEKNIPLFLAQSYAKNFGLYGERVGALSIVTKDTDEKGRVESQLKLIARAMYSSPPIHGAKIVAKVLNDTSLAKEWEREVKAMAVRIIEMRNALRQKLQNLGSKHNWDHISNQIGMFCYTGLNEQQVKRITDEFHVYMTNDGRISIPGINTNNIDNLAKAIHEVTK